MRWRYASIFLVLLTITALPAAAQRGWRRPDRPRSGACFYRDLAFHGDYFCLRPGDRWPTLPHEFNDQITSIQIFGRARVRVFNDSGFRGINTGIDRSIPDLRRFRLRRHRHKSWNDRISSVAVFGERDDWNRRDRRRWDQRRGDRNDQYNQGY